MRRERAHCLLPGFTDSLNLPDEFAKLSSLNRLARAEEQAKVAAFLLSDDSSYITGQSIRSDEGVTRHMKLICCDELLKSIFIFLW